MIHATSPDISTPSITSTMKMPHKKRSMSILPGYQYAPPLKDTMPPSSHTAKQALGRPILWKDSNTVSLMKIEASFLEPLKISSLILRLEAKIRRSHLWSEPLTSRSITKMLVTCWETRRKICILEKTQRKEYTWKVYQNGRWSDHRKSLNWWN